jgi:hypothetical protein
MRRGVLILACLPMAHKNPTPEQIRKFNQLQKKKQRDAKG